MVLIEQNLFYDWKSENSFINTAANFLTNTITFEVDRK